MTDVFVRVRGFVIRFRKDVSTDNSVPLFNENCLPKTLREDF
jgi:hypothetical protein